MSGISYAAFRDGEVIMSVVIERLELGTLQAKVEARMIHARQRGLIHTIPPRFELVEQDGVNFLIEAVLLCPAEFERSAFYNAGEAAGASQWHKHVQMVAPPLAAEVAHLPIEPFCIRPDLRGR